MRLWISPTPVVSIQHELLLTRIARCVCSVFRLQVACAERSPLEVGGTSLVLLPPFLHACVFLLRRLLSLLGPLAASSIGVLVPLLFDAVLVEANSTAAGTLEQQQHSPELAAELLSGFFMQLFVSLKGPPLLFLLLQHFPLYVTTL